MDSELFKFEFEIAKVEYCSYLACIQVANCSAMRYYSTFLPIVLANDCDIGAVQSLA